MIISFDTGKIETTGGGGSSSGLLQQKKLIITNNGLDVAIPDDGYDGLSTVYVKTYVSNSSGKKDFTVLGYDEETDMTLNEEIDDDIANSNVSNPNAETCVYFPLNAIYQPTAFINWSKLKYIPPIFFANYTTTSSGGSQFSNCYNLKEVDLSLCTHTFSSAIAFCSNCYMLKKVKFNKTTFTNGVNASSMFENTVFLEELDFDGIDFKPTSLSTFLKNSGCKKVKNLDSSLCTSFNSMCNGCKVTELCRLSLKSLNNTNTNKQYFLGGQLIDFGGFIDCENLADWGTSTYNPFYSSTNLEIIREMGSIKGKNFNVSRCTKLTVESLMIIINALYDYVGNGETVTQTCTLGSTNLAKLTDEQKSIAINKGWTLA